MALDGKLLALARKQLDDIRHHNEDLQSARRREVYARIPRVRQIDGALQGQMRRLAQVTMAGGKTLADDLAALEAENRALQDERRARLAGAGFDPDYTGEVYDCPDCRDTGYVNGKLCHCLRRLYNAQVTKHLSKLLRGDERFSGFDLSFYPDIPDRNGDNPRECMSIIRDFCEAYARGFDGQGPNLIFSGGPGLGKTFLSACIAKVVSENGWSVAYDSASACLGAFEKERFSRDGDEKAAAGATVRQYLSCDLMILDDLGTEMNTSAAQSALYTLINHRLTAGKQTIISTNLSEPELEQQYSPQIASRLLGEYQWLHFLGSDIRRR